LEYIASRVFDTRDEWAVEKLRHGHAMLGAYTNDAGATVVTSGSTDWAHGLTGRDPRTFGQFARDHAAQFDGDVAGRAPLPAGAR
jgi:hypothetical protein